MADQDPEILRAAIFEVLENQLRDNLPSETRETLNRLLAEGFPENEAKRLIACALSTEIFAVMKSGKPSDSARYIGYLKKLPAMPWEE